jgi:hypothetical protein
LPTTEFHGAPTNLLRTLQSKVVMSLYPNWFWETFANKG